MPRAGPGVADMRASLREVAGEGGAAAVEAGPEMPAARGSETAISTFGSDESPPTETRGVASGTETGTGTETVSATETGIGIVTETATATENGATATAIPTGFAGPRQAGADRHPREIFVPEINHLV